MCIFVYLWLVPHCTDFVTHIWIHGMHIPNICMYICMWISQVNASYSGPGFKFWPEKPAVLYKTFCAFSQFLQAKPRSCLKPGNNYYIPDLSISQFQYRPMFDAIKNYWHNHVKTVNKLNYKYREILVTQDMWNRCTNQGPQTTWARDVAWPDEMRNAYIVLVRKLETLRPHGDLNIYGAITLNLILQY